MTDPYVQANYNVLSSGVLGTIAAQCLTDSERWFPNVHAVVSKEDHVKHLAYLTLALVGEGGELANEVKKVWRGTHPYEASRDEIVSEVVDVFIYLMNLVGTLDMDLYQEYMKKRAICEGRWGPAARAYDYTTEGLGGT